MFLAAKMQLNKSICLSVRVWSTRNSKVPNLIKGSLRFLRVQERFFKVQGSFREGKGKVQSRLKEGSWKVHGRFREGSGKVRGRFREGSGKRQEMFRETSGKVL